MAQLPSLFFPDRFPAFQTIPHALSDQELSDLSLAVSMVKGKHLLRIENAVGDTPNSEAHNRFTLNELTFYGYDHAHKSRSTKSNPSTCSPNGRPDYSIWYGDEEESSVNAIAIEAKSDSRFPPGIPQALGYTGAVHRHRKEQKKQDCT
ncbi:hypothetical protein PENSOL_c017G03142 [Penicillium solitum]|uniref:Uncharacterized protein n=1 Tax=Penicillium solitum TaxID=60172 RepID=A0A1V6R3Q9_9EURO|nr:uncharacterized protein PENSOL_c017G03142 [Penicillium solitum]OQD96128.1 hypothetical protein PENSOL_c017G03142 [Penicillium solitum]